MCNPPPPHRHQSLYIHLFYYFISCWVSAGSSATIISNVWTRWGDSFCRCNQMADAPLLQNLPVESKSQRLSDKLSHIICYNKQTSLLNYIVPFGIRNKLLKESLASDIFQIFHNKQTKWFLYSSLRETYCNINQPCVSKYNTVASHLIFFCLRH